MFNAPRLSQCVDNLLLMSGPNLHKQCCGDNVCPAYDVLVLPCQMSDRVENNLRPYLADSHELGIFKGVSEIRLCCLYKQYGDASGIFPIKCVMRTEFLVSIVWASNAIRTPICESRIQISGTVFHG